MKTKDLSKKERKVIRFWLREISFLIGACTFFILVFALTPSEITEKHFTTENFKNLVFLLLIVIVCLKEFKSQKVSADFYKIVWLIVGFYFGGSMLESTISQ